MNRRNFIKGLLAIGPIAAVAKLLPQAQAAATMPRYGFPINLPPERWPIPGTSIQMRAYEDLAIGDFVSATSRYTVERSVASEHPIGVVQSVSADGTVWISTGGRMSYAPPDG